MLPPLPAEATRASNDVGPSPKSTPFTLMLSPLLIDVTSKPPSLHTSVSTPDSQAMVSASVWAYGLRLPTPAGPPLVILMVGMVPSALYLNCSTPTERWYPLPPGR